MNNEKIEKAISVKIQEYEKLINDYKKLSEYIKPFIAFNQEIKDLDLKISNRMIAIPVSDMIINNLLLTEIKIIKNNFETLKKDYNEHYKNINDA